MVNITVLFKLVKPNENGGHSNLFEHCRGVYNVVVLCERVFRWPDQFKSKKK